MTFLSIVLALLIEQWRERSVLKSAGLSLIQMTDWFDAGLSRRGIGPAARWWILVGGAVCVCQAVQFFLLRGNGFLLLAFNVLVLYWTMGLRYEGRYLTDIIFALRMGEIDRARAVFAQWCASACHTHTITTGQLIRLSIEKNLTSVHRHVLGVLLYFLFFGAAGATAYRLACFLGRDRGLCQIASGIQSDVTLTDTFAQRAFFFMDWLPQRVTAIIFSIAGNFEDAQFCWRTQTALWPDKNDGVILASGAGALGTQLGGALNIDGHILSRPELGVSAHEAGVEKLQASAGLAWRALALFLLLPGLIAIARWVGG